MNEIAQELNRLLNAYVNNGGAEVDAAPLREFLWDNKAAILQDLMAFDQAREQHAAGRR